MRSNPPKVKAFDAIPASYRPKSSGRSQVCVAPSPRALKNGVEASRRYIHTLLGDHCSARAMDGPQNRASPKSSAHSVRERPLRYMSRNTSAAFGPMDSAKVWAWRRCVVVETFLSRMK